MTSVINKFNDTLNMKFNDGLSIGTIICMIILVQILRKLQKDNAF